MAATAAAVSAAPFFFGAPPGIQHGYRGTAGPSTRTPRIKRTDIGRAWKPSRTSDLNLSRRTQSRVSAHIQPYGPEDEYEVTPDEQVFSFLTPDGVFQFSSPVRASGPGRAPRRKVAQDPLPTWNEQGLCIASTFSLAATNGRDLSRRVIWQGYAQSVPHLVEAVEDTVLWRGGKVALQECRAVETYSQALNMTVVLPFLWSSGYSGIPELDTLNYAITEAGGVIEAVKKQWHIL